MGALALGVPEALEDRRQALVGFAEVGELVEDEDEAFGHGVAQGGVPVGELDVGDEVRGEAVGHRVAEGAQVVLLADLGRLEADGAPALAEALEELSLADAATTVEDEELGAVAGVELFEETELLFASEEHGRNILWRIIRSSMFHGVVLSH